MKRLLFKAIMVGTIVCLLTACTGTQVGKQPNSKVGDIHVGISFAFKDSPYHVALEDYLLLNAKTYTEKTGRKINIISKTANRDVNKQSEDIKSLIEQGVDVLLIYPQDSIKIHSSIAFAHSKGIPVIMYTRAASESGEKADVYVGLDTFKQAYVTAVALFELMKKDGIKPEVLNITGDMADINAFNRDRGLKVAAKQYNVSILNDITTNWEHDKADKGLSDALTAYPQVNCIFVASDYLIGDVKEVLVRFEKWFPYGNMRHIYLGSQDVAPLSIKMMREGYMDFDTAADIWPISTKTIQLIVSLADKEILDKDSYLIEGRLVSKNNINTIENLWSQDYPE